VEKPRSSRTTIIGAMQPGTSTGEFTYTPADDGTFTVQVQQAPISAVPGDLHGALSGRGSPDGLR
jgi:hypothetical protein